MRSPRQRHGGPSSCAAAWNTLGLDRVNPVYYETIKLLYTFPQSVGIMGGQPLSSYYFIGVQGEGLFYLNPHHSRWPYFAHVYSVADLRTFHCEKVRKMPLMGLDPSMLLGSVCRNEAEW
ncbi:hypothetical protein B0H17DRAFT_948658, partial [Mycena rosella]